MNTNKLYCGDCKTVLQKLIKEQVTVDLIYLDPPFNSSAVYNLTYKNNAHNSNAQQIAFHDMWTPTAHTQQMFENFMEEIKDADIDDTVKIFLKAWMESLNNSDVNSQKLLNYLLYMTERLLLMQHVLKDTGSIYLHCDPTASHYLKIIMDGIFGRDNFRNEIVWSYRTGGSSRHSWAKKHDIILFYSKSTRYCFNTQKEKSYTKSKNRKPGIIDYGAGTAEFIADEQGIFTWVNARDVWDIPYINSQAKERLGYPTQKPRALLERIIKASCPKDGIVLDPFCGSGTSIDVAIRLNRQWIGIDISSFAIEIIEQRIEENGLETTYDLQYIRPQTWDEYKNLNAYEKQDFLIHSLGGIPNKKKSGDGGIDGTLIIHRGIDKNGDDMWGKVLFSVKTGKQNGPELIRELKGTVQSNNAHMGILILDRDPSYKTIAEAEKSKVIRYVFDIENYPPQEYNSIQIYTATQILDGIRLNAPPSMVKIQNYRRSQHELF